MYNSLLIRITIIHIRMDVYIITGYRIRSIYFAKLLLFIETAKSFVFNFLIQKLITIFAKNKTATIWERENFYFY